MDFKWGGASVATLTILPAGTNNPTTGYLSEYRNPTDTGDIISIRSNLKQSGSTLVLIDTTQTGWNVNFGAFSNAFNVQTFQVGGSLIDLLTLSSSGSLLMNRNATGGLLQNDNASVNRKLISLDASNNVPIGDLALANSQLQFNGIPYFKGTTGTTGSTAAALSATSPSVGTAVYTWIKVLAPDGSTVFIPCWK